MSDQGGNTLTWEKLAILEPRLLTVESTARAYARSCGPGEAPIGAWYGAPDHDPVWLARRHADLIAAGGEMDEDGSATIRWDQAANMPRRGPDYSIIGQPRAFRAQVVALVGWSASRSGPKELQTHTAYDISYNHVLSVLTGETWMTGVGETG